jgi:hypothetical protein
MSGSSMSSPPRATKVTSSRRPQSAAREKITGSSSCSAARPAREDQRVVRPRVAPSGPDAPEVRRGLSRRANPLRRSEEQPAPSCHLFDAETTPARTPCKGANRGRGRQARRRRRVHRRRRIPTPPCDVSGLCISGAAEP